MSYLGDCKNTGSSDFKSRKIISDLGATADELMHQVLQHEGAASVEASDDDEESVEAEEPISRPPSFFEAIECAKRLQAYAFAHDEKLIDLSFKMMCEIESNFADMRLKTAKQSNITDYFSLPSM